MFDPPRLDTFFFFLLYVADLYILSGTSSSRHCWFVSIVDLTILFVCLLPPLLSSHLYFVSNRYSMVSNHATPPLRLSFSFLLLVQYISLKHKICLHWIIGSLCSQHVYYFGIISSSFKSLPKVPGSDPIGYLVSFCKVVICKAMALTSNMTLFVADYFYETRICNVIIASYFDFFLALFTFMCNLCILIPGDIIN